MAARKALGLEDMKKIYHNYLKWEDWKHGMFNMKSLNEDDLIQKAVTLLRDPTSLKYEMRWVAYNWPYSAAINLTNRSLNRQAWLGQAACCHKYGVPEYITKKAWHLLSDRQKELANAVADEVIIARETYYVKAQNRG
jgi:hypothetical protein